MVYTLFAVAILLIVVSAAVSVVVHSIRLGISPMPTAPKVLKTLEETLPPPESFEKGSIIFDLGSGWGTLVVLLAKRYPHCQIVGVEGSPVPHIFSRFFVMWKGLTNIKLLHRDFFDVRLLRANMVVAYLFPHCMERLAKKLERELNKGAIVVTHTFALPGWNADSVVKAPDIYRTPIYRYYKSRSNASNVRDD